jgi:extradiol dioxygenase family protein
MDASVLNPDSSPVQRPRFHLAIPVTDLEQARDFYAQQLGCATGRESSRWIDFDFFGHQLVTHLLDTADHPSVATNDVSGHEVPASHFGIIMPWADYEGLLAQLTARGVAFVIDHHIRFPDRPGEQATFFLKDPSDNHLEFKAFRNMDMLFAKDLERY